MARPKKEINWKLVEQKMQAGCSAEEIYNDPDTMMDQDTFYRRFKEEYGVGFADCRGKFYSSGQGNIRYTQFAKAMKGDNTMLLLLGREMLGQKDKNDDNKKQSVYNIMVPHDLAIGSNLSAEAIPNPDNQSTQ